MGAMNPEILFKFKNLFEEQRRKLLYSNGVINGEFQLQKEDLPDEMDLLASELEASMRLRLRNREALFLKKIDEALHRISQGTFGQCETCGENIELRRLEARPTAHLCISCKEVEELSEYHHIDGHLSKSLGKKFQLA